MHSVILIASFFYIIQNVTFQYNTFSENAILDNDFLLGIGPMLRGKKIKKRKRGGGERGVSAWLTTERYCMFKREK
jgi:hypothetical protein